MSIIGIDLGTTYCAVAQLDDLGRPNIISINGANITPSVVEFSPEKTLVGLEAKKALDHGPRDNIAQEIHCYMQTLLTLFLLNQNLFHR